MYYKFHRLPISNVRLLPSIFTDRMNLNIRYIKSLSSENLLRNFYSEAGLINDCKNPENIHFGWESPTCQLRGHFLGHWLSAAAKICRNDDNEELKAKADHIIAELGRCQKENGGEWAGSIPEKYLDWIAEGKDIWAPHYTIHKTMMGLWDMYQHAGNSQAFDILNRWADWFYRWTSKYSSEQINRILDVETGGMLEIWADLYGVTKKQEHLELINRYYRSALFDRLLASEDVLTNMHANTTIPEIMGAVRAWEVTGEQRWKNIVESYWNCAVNYRGYFCTGGQTIGEVWTPPGEQSAHLSINNQEHCTVYNMMRLAESLLTWTGDASYADYWERNVYNGILAQQNPQTGMVAYYLPLQAGATKKWGSPTENFWCCHGTMIQAQSSYSSSIFYEDDDGLVVNQYIPSEVRYNRNDSLIKVMQNFRNRYHNCSRSESMIIDINVKSERPMEFAIKFRIPWWIIGDASITISGKRENVKLISSNYHRINRIWYNDQIQLILPRALYPFSLLDNPEVVAFMDGPVVLAGLCAEERVLYGDINKLNTILVPDNEREWGRWKGGYRTMGQDFGFKLQPLYEIRDEKFQVYFQVIKKRQ